MERDGKKVRVIVAQPGNRVYDRAVASGSAVQIVLP